MPTFRLERKIPSSAVNRDLLLEIGAYLLRIKDRFPSERENVSFDIKDRLGTEVCHSAEELPKQFPDGTQTVKISYSQGLNGSVSVDLQFDSDPMFSKLEIGVTSTSAREVAVGLSEGIDRLLAPRKTYSWMFYPHPGISAVLFLIVPMSATLAVVRGIQVGLDYIVASAAAVFVCTGTYFLGRNLHPYSVFDSRINEIRQRWWRWLVQGLLTFLFFGTILTFARKYALGF